ncbi:MAG: hypothetical protein RIQ33_116 [Bacteroidota bacterium]|jgi:hypothetical protein
MKPSLKILFIVSLFAIAMGFLETAVVVYLRELYYPDGFDFPMVATSNLVLKTELLREFATLIMLIAVGLLAGKTKAQQFVYFLYSFAIWDLFYYVFLKWLLNWPASFFTWDILFLLPMPWYGPVLAPCIISITMILLTGLVIHFERKNILIQFNWMDLLLLISGSLIFIYSFTSEFINWFLMGNHKINKMGFEFIPQHYNWLVFSIAEIILLIDFVWIYKRHKSNLNY